MVIIAIRFRGVLPGAAPEPTISATETQCIVLPFGDVAARIVRTVITCNCLARIGKGTTGIVVEADRCGVAIRVDIRIRGRSVRSPLLIPVIGVLYGRGLKLVKRRLVPLIFVGVTNDHSHARVEASRMKPTHRYCRCAGATRDSFAW